MTETPRSNQPLGEFLADRERVLIVDIAALKQLIASRETELETIRAAKAVRHADG